MGTLIAEFWPGHLRLSRRRILTADAARAAKTDLAATLRMYTLAVGIVTGLIVFAGLYPISDDAPTLVAGLRSHASPLFVVAALAGLAASCCCIADVIRWQGFLPLPRLVP